jgi:hypothetical protein
LPRYFFHLATDAGYSIDEEGLQFEDLDAAYLDACRAVLDMSLHMLRLQQDPNQHRFDIADDDGAILLDIPFSEIMRSSTPAALPVKTADLHDTLRDGIARNKSLRDELAGQIASACEALGETRRLLSRS